MVDRDRDALPAERGDELGGLLDGLRAVVVGREWRLAAAAARAVHGGARFSEGGGDAASRAPRRTGDEGNTPAQRVRIGRPHHHSSLPRSLRDGARSNRITRWLWVSTACALAA